MTSPSSSLAIVSSSQAVSSSASALASSCAKEAYLELLPGSDRADMNCACLISMCCMQKQDSQALSCQTLLLVLTILGQQFAALLKS